LVELMIVVAMVGVLAALALVGYRKYIASAQTSEATALLSSIRASQESFKSEALSYLPVSGDDLAAAQLFPRDRGALDGRKVGWGEVAPSALGGRWRQLNVNPGGPVRFGYACVADFPGTAPPGAYNGAPDPLWANAYGGGVAPEPWFIAVAVADRDDDDTVFAVVQAASFSNEVFIHDDTE